MAITNGYATLEELKAEVQLHDSIDDTRIERYITTISRLIDRHCGFPLRRFYADTEDVTRYFDADVARHLFIPDLKELTSLAVDTSGSGAFTAWTVDDDFVLLPHNAVADAGPFTAVEVTSSSGKTLPAGVVKGVRIVGKWGWPAVPPEVTDACLLQSQKLFKSSQAPLGIAAPATLDAPGMRLLSKLHPEVELLLQPLVRRPVGVS